MHQPLGPLNALYPTPAVLVGALVNSRHNFITIAHVGILTHTHLSLGIAKVHYTNAGIRENKTFSICLPSENLMVETDYCGIMTGKNTDKAALFDVFYGELKTAPMIRECALCMECRLDRVVDYPKHDVFVGEIVQTHAKSEALRDGLPDVEKIRPLLFDMSRKEYFGLGRSVGRSVGRCWNAGKQLKNPK